MLPRLRDGSRMELAELLRRVTAALEYYREGESEKHLRDIAGVIKVTGDELDRSYIKEWVRRLDLEVVWRQVLERLEQEP